MRIGQQTHIKVSSTLEFVFRENCGEIALKIKGDGPSTAFGRMTKQQAATLGEALKILRQ